MNLVDRVKNIILTPNTEWPVIAQEPASTAAIVTGYVVPLAAVVAVARFIGLSIVGVSGFFGSFRVPIVAGLTGAVVSVVMTIVGLFLVSLVVNALAPTFGGQKNGDRAMQLVAYSSAPAFALGVLMIIPALGTLAALGGLYGFYLFYLGVPFLMKSPADKSVAYTAVAFLCTLVMWVVIGALIATIGIGTMGAAGMFGGSGASTPSSAEVEFDKDSPLGKLQDLGKAMEESNKKMEAAQKSGDSNAATAAAMEALGTMLGGGRRVDPLEIDQLKAFLPDRVAGLSKQGPGTAEKTGMAGIMISTAEAIYSDGGSKQVTVEVADPGGASGLMGLASWAGIQGARESADGMERTTKVNGRIVHEKSSKSGNDEYAVVLGDRFVVSAKSNDIKLDQLKGIVGSLDLSRLEGMKDVGVQKK